jgi:GT2 family glycosyltransferase
VGGSEDEETTTTLPVVLVYRNQPRLLVDTVAAFRAQDVPVRFVVVDNDSELPPTVEGDDIEVIAAGGNTGFGPGANLGFRHLLDAGTDAGAEGPLGEWIALAPHDALPAPGCLRQLLDAVAEHPEAGFVCADVGDGETPIMNRFLGGITGPATVDAGWEPAGYPHGTLLLARRRMLAEVGLFDERYFAYCEETDLALRAAAAGWTCGLVRGARVHNPILAGTLSAVSYLQMRNTLLLLREHAGRRYAIGRAIVAVGQLAKGTVFPRRRDPYYHFAGRAWALVDHARGRYGPPPARLTAARLRASGTGAA